MDLTVYGQTECICGLQAGLQIVAGAVARDDYEREIDLTQYDSGWDRMLVMIQYLSDQVSLLNSNYRVQFSHPDNFGEEPRKDAARPAFYCVRINERGERRLFIVSRAKQGLRYVQN